MRESIDDLYLAEETAEWKAADALDARAAEIVQLRAERDEYQQAADKMAMEHKVERDTLRAELAALKADAERYKWLKDSSGREWDEEYFPAFMTGWLDEAIDKNITAARAHLAQPAPSTAGKRAELWGHHPVGQVMRGSLDHAEKLADALDECSTRINGTSYGLTVETMRASARMIRAFHQKSTKPAPTGEGTR
jgi:hypothetical protein